MDLRQGLASSTTSSRNPFSSRDPELWRTHRPLHAPPLDTTDDEDPTLPERALPNSYWATPTLLASEYPGAIDASMAARRLNRLLDLEVVDFFNLTEEGELLSYAGILQEEARKRGWAFLEMPGSEPLKSNPHRGKVQQAEERDNEPHPHPSAVMASWAGKPPVHTVRYGRFPIRDRGLPSHDTLRTIMSALSASQSQGRRADVHCWGGIGRAGTIVGCWLVQAGLVHRGDVVNKKGEVAGTVPAGEAALAVITKKWKGVDKNWKAPKTPETTAQRKLVKWFEGFDAEELK